MSMPSKAHIFYSLAPLSVFPLNNIAILRVGTIKIMQRECSERDYERVAAKRTARESEMRS